MKANALHASLLAAGLLVASITQAQTSYQFIFLGTGQADAINDAGEVVGTSNLGATIWYQGNKTGISNSFAATAINNAGQIAGQSNSATYGAAALWSGPGLTLTNLNGNYTYATAVNSSGQVVGNSETSAFFWNGTTASNLAVVNNGWATASGINDTGVAAGNVNYSTPDVCSQGYGCNTSVAATWSGNGTKVTLLNSLGGMYSDAYAINNAGVVVGASTPASNNGLIAVEWNGTTATALNSLGGPQSAATAINNAGVVVGYSENAADTTYATMWKGTTAINLNTLLTPSEVQAGWVLQTATGINSSGSIVGIAYNPNIGEWGTMGSFELQAINPVPEPDGWAMLITGLGLIAALRYRKFISFKGDGALMAA